MRYVVIGWEKTENYEVFRVFRPKIVRDATKIDFYKSPPFCFIEFKRFFDQILWQIHFLNINFKPEGFELNCFRVYF